MLLPRLRIAFFRIPQFRENSHQAPGLFLALRREPEDINRAIEVRRRQVATVGRKRHLENPTR